MVLLQDEGVDGPRPVHRGILLNASLHHLFFLLDERGLVVFLLDAAVVLLVAVRQDEVRVVQRFLVDSGGQQLFVSHFEAIAIWSFVLFEQLLG